MSHAAAVAADVVAAVAADVDGASAAAAMPAAAVTHAATAAAAAAESLTQSPCGTATKHPAAASGLMRALTPCQHQQHSHWVMWTSSGTMGSAIGAALDPVS